MLFGLIEVPLLTALPEPQMAQDTNSSVVDLYEAAAGRCELSAALVLCCDLEPALQCGRTCRLKNPKPQAPAPR